MVSPEEAQQNRLQVFANVFKGYMGVMPIITAALAPLATMMNVIPVYESQRKPLASLTGVLGFLLLAWLFSIRRTIALGTFTHRIRWFINVSPLVLIFSSVACYVGYDFVLESSLAAVVSCSRTRTMALDTWGQNNPITGSRWLQLLYLGVFLCAEAAFVMMALREYTLDVLKISEYDWMFGKQDSTGMPLVVDRGTEVTPR